MDAPEIAEALRKYRFGLTVEKTTQAEISGVLKHLEIEHEREWRLGPKDIADFKVGNIAMEVKLKGGKMALYRQIERYAQYEEVHCLILITLIAMGFPSEVAGKKVYVVNLARAWL